MESHCTIHNLCTIIEDKTGNIISVHSTLITASFRVRAALLASNLSAVFCSLSLSFLASDKAVSRYKTFSLSALSLNDPRALSTSEDFNL